MISEFILPVVCGVKRFYTPGSTSPVVPQYSSRMGNRRGWWDKAQAIRREKMRLGKAMRYADIAAAIGVKPERLGHWFVGRRPAPVPMVEAIAQYMGVNIVDFFMPDDGTCVTDPKIVAAVKLMSLMSDEQKSAVLPKSDSRPKRGTKHGRRGKLAA